MQFGGMNRVGHVQIILQSPQSPQSNHLAFSPLEIFFVLLLQNDEKLLTNCLSLAMLMDFKNCS